MGRDKYLAPSKAYGLPTASINNNHDISSDYVLNAAHDLFQDYLKDAKDLVRYVN